MFEQLVRRVTELHRLYEILKVVYGINDIGFLESIADTFDNCRVFFVRGQHQDLTQFCYRVHEDMRHYLFFCHDQALRFKKSSTAIAYGEAATLESATICLMQIQHDLVTQGLWTYAHYQFTLTSLLAFIKRIPSPTILAVAQDCVDDYRCLLEKTNRYEDVIDLLERYLYAPEVQRYNTHILAGDDPQLSAYKNKLLNLYMRLGYAHFELAKKDYRHFDSAALLFEFVYVQCINHEILPLAVFNSRHALFKVNQSLGNTALSRGDHARAAQYADILEQLAIANGEMRKLGMAYYLKGRVAAMTGQFSQAAKYYNHSYGIILNYLVNLNICSPELSELLDNATITSSLAYNCELHDMHEASELYQQAVQKLLSYKLQRQHISEPDSPVGSVDSSISNSPVGSVHTSASSSSVSSVHTSASSSPRFSPAGSPKQ